MLEAGQSLDRLSELLGHHVEFSSTAWDRLVLNGYRDRLQRPEHMVHCFRAVVGVPAVTPEVRMRRTAPYRTWVAQYAAAPSMPLLAAPELDFSQSGCPGEGLGELLEDSPGDFHEVGLRSGGHSHSYGFGEIIVG